MKTDPLGTRPPTETLKRRERARAREKTDRLPSSDEERNKEEHARGGERESVRRSPGMTDAERATGKEEARNEVIGRRTPVISFSDIASPPLIDRDPLRLDSNFECFAPEMNQ